MRIIPDDYPYSIKQQRVKHVPLPVQIRDLTINLNRKIAGVHEKQEADPETLKIWADKEKIVIWCAQTQAASRDSAQGNRKWKTWAQTVDQIRYAPNPYPDLPTRWTVGVSLEAGKHLIKALKDLNFSKNFDFTEHALCTQMRPEIWCPSGLDNESIQKAVALCYQCPVREKCLKTIYKIEKNSPLMQIKCVVGGIPAATRLAFARVYQAREAIKTLPHCIETHTTPDGKPATPSEVKAYKRSLNHNLKILPKLEIQQKQAHLSYMRLSERILKQLNKEVEENA